MFRGPIRSGRDVSDIETVGKENAASLYRTGFLKAKMANPLKDSRVRGAVQQIQQS